MNCLTPNCKGELIWTEAHPPWPAHYRCSLCGSPYNSKGKRFKKNHLKPGNWGMRPERNDPEVKEVAKVEENHEAKKYICSVEGCNKEISEERSEGSGLCSKCQTKAWQKDHRRVAESKSEAGEMWKCDCGCGEVFTKTRHDQRFFSKACRDKWGREEKRRKAKANKGNGSPKRTRIIPKIIPSKDPVTPELLFKAVRKQIFEEFIQPIEDKIAEMRGRFAL